MSSIVTSVLNAPIGWLVAKGRDVTAEKLKEGDVTDQKIHDDTTKCAFYQARRRFETSREKATDASNNEALKTFDRITAIRYRVMAAVLQSVVEKVAVTADLSSLSINSALENALPECEQCLQKLHSLPAVQESCKVELEKRLRNIKGRFGKDERREIISTVCQINRTTYTATQAVGKVWVWPFIDTGEDKIDPLRDERVRRVLHKIDMTHCSITPWSIGGAGEVKHELKDPRSIATNIYGAILLVDNGDKTVKEFDKKGNLCLNFTPQSDDAYPSLDIHDVATDNLEDKIYLLISVNEPGAKDWDWKWEVQFLTSLLTCNTSFP